MAGWLRKVAHEPSYFSQAKISQVRDSVKWQLQVQALSVGRRPQISRPGGFWNWWRNPGHRRARAGNRWPPIGRESHTALHPLRARQPIPGPNEADGKTAGRPKRRSLPQNQPRQREIGRCARLGSFSGDPSARSPWKRCAPGRWRRSPRVAAGFDDVVVAFEAGFGELVGAQVLSDVFDRVDLGRTGRAGEWRDVQRDDQVRAALAIRHRRGPEQLARPVL